MKGFGCKGVDTGNGIFARNYNFWCLLLYDWTDGVRQIKGLAHLVKVKS